MLLLQGRQCTQDLCSIQPVTCERYCQRSSYIQRTHPRINLHWTWIPVADQYLDDFPGLAMIVHVHDIAVPEGVWRCRNRKVYPVRFGPSDSLLWPVTHGFVSNVSVSLLSNRCLMRLSYRRLQRFRLLFHCPSTAGIRQEPSAYFFGPVTG